MYIGVDCGTQSTKVVVVDVERGVILGEGSRPHRLDEGEHGRREQAPAEWLAALKGAFFQAIERAGIDAKQVRGLSRCEKICDRHALDSTSGCDARQMGATPISPGRPAHTALSGRSARLVVDLCL